ncbi:hypothetical protein BU251_02765 [Candidatus Velamenicoccus archaeovorus]|uniref:Bacteriophage lambda Replication protein O N-terminal domain-containing protein n=1 Tax=Velamenicoccus archaeovorus TaxID=1930593 RepID=A0A410P3I4_VELA1|nr:replication protein [Candidatus Velamenicoccus archaeovorus]QAT16729.1 hypothetical protein BU251_02765 [Candidatus Velamenicoccus archaeovorus]
MGKSYHHNDGFYTKINNDLLAALYKCPFNGTELRLILVVIRRTYGWNKASAFISYGCLADELGVDKRSIRRSMKLLVQDKVIFKESSFRTNLFSVNKDYASWRLWKSPDPRNKNVPPNGADEDKADPQKRGEVILT